jgi:hypothetical protein
MPGKITLIFDGTNGPGFRDNACFPALSSVVGMYDAGTELTLFTGSSNMVTALQVLVKRGVFSHENVRFVYRTPAARDIAIRVDRTGRLEYWPEGFGDFMEKCLEELLDWNDERPVEKDYDVGNV